MGSKILKVFSAPVEHRQTLKVDAERRVCKFDLKLAYKERV